jgi:NAD(P)-dependent dehydrogenase (short-subunit alcohol dehydrogenase family)/acyl carrier protein
MNDISLLKNIPVVAEQSTTGDSVLKDVTNIFADITRYPKEIIDPNADLETDLGVDSVKFGEIFAVLRQRYTLPDQEVMRSLPRERFRTVGGIADLIAELGVARDAPAATSPEPAPRAESRPAKETTASPTPQPAAKAGSDASLLAGVTQVFADMTRYPVEILDADADFENDLGIDSVKLGEIFAVLREKYHLPAPEVLRERWQPNTIRSIRGIADGIAFLDEGATPPPVASPRAPTIVAAAPRVPAERKLAGKIALITGSGRGLGRDIALHLGRLGATVLVNSFHTRSSGEETTEEIRREGGTAHHLWGSVANMTQLHKMFDTIETEFGGLDYLISNASNGLLGPLDQIQPEHWEKALRTNVIGLHQSALRARPMMKARGGGRIITMSSVAAHRYVDYFGCMGPMKAAVESLTKFLAVEFQPDNILVNCISAGAVYGQLVDKWPDSKRLLPIWEAGAGGKLCTGADIAQFVEYLLGDGASMINGSILIMDGGQTARG